MLCKNVSCPFLPFFRSLPFYCTILLLSALQLYRISCSKVLGKNGKWVSEESRVLNDPSNRFYDVLWCFTLVKRTRKHEVSLTDDIFETGVYGAPSKSQNPIVLGQSGPSSSQYSNSSWGCHWHHPFDIKNYPPFWHSTRNQVFSPALDFLFFSKIRLEITNIWFGDIGNLSE